jgi:hypothetical protein
MEMKGKKNETKPEEPGFATGELRFDWGLDADEIGDEKLNEHAKEINMQEIITAMKDEMRYMLSDNNANLVTKIREIIDTNNERVKRDAEIHESVNRGQLLRKKTFIILCLGGLITVITVTFLLIAFSSNYHAVKPRSLDAAPLSARYEDFM